MEGLSLMTKIEKYVTKNNPLYSSHLDAFVFIQKLCNQEGFTFHHIGENNAEYSSSCSSVDES